MKIIGINTASRACVYSELSCSEDGSMFLFGDIIITRLGLLFRVEFNSKLMFFSCDEVVEEIIFKEWKE